MLKKLAYHGVTVSNLDKSIVFYRDRMRMSLESSYELKGEALEKATGLSGAQAKVPILRFQDHYTKLLQFVSPKGKQYLKVQPFDVGYSHIAIKVDSVQKMYDDMVAHGVKFISPPVHPIPEKPEVIFNYSLDPDGIAVELLQTIHHLARTVDDLDRSMAFYQGMMGLETFFIRVLKGKGIEEGMQQKGVDLRAYHMGIDHTESVELFSFFTPRGKAKQTLKLNDVGSTFPAFEVDDLQKTYEEYKAKGAKFLSAPVQVSKKPDVTSVLMLDPDNYIVELRQGDILKG